MNTNKNEDVIIWYLHDKKDFPALGEKHEINNHIYEVVDNQIVYQTTLVLIKK